MNEFSERYKCEVHDIGDGVYHLYHKCYYARVCVYDDGRYIVEIWENHRVEYMGETLVDYISKDKAYSILDRYFPLKTIEELKLF